MKPIILVFLLQIGSLAPMALVCPWSDEDRSVTVEASPDLEQWVALARVEPEEGFRVETPAASPVFYRITCSTNPPDTSSPVVPPVQPPKPSHLCFVVGCEAEAALVPQLRFTFQSDFAPSVTDLPALRVCQLHSQQPNAATWLLRASGWAWWLDLMREANAYHENEPPTVIWLPLDNTQP